MLSEKDYSVLDQTERCLFECFDYFCALQTNLRNDEECCSDPFIDFLVQSLGQELAMWCNVRTFISSIETRLSILSEQNRIF